MKNTQSASTRKKAQKPVGRTLAADALRLVLGGAILAKCHPDDPSCA